jgi:hypothetical protein
VKANILRIIGSVVKQMMGFNDKGVDPWIYTQGKCV